MLRSYGNIGQAQLAGSVYKPKPEEMLQQVKVQKADLQDKLADMKRINDWNEYSLVGEANQLAEIIGRIMARLWDLDKEEEYWLNEMNK